MFKSKIFTSIDKKIKNKKLESIIKIDVDRSFNDNVNID